MDMSMTVATKIKELDDQKSIFGQQIASMRNRYEREIECLSTAHQKELISIENHTDSVIREIETKLESIVKHKDIQIESLKLDLQSIRESKASKENFLSFE